MHRNFVVTSQPIPTGNITLGSLIVSLATPEQGAHSPLTPSAADLLPPEPQKSYKSLVRRYKKTRLAPHLAAIGFTAAGDEDDKVVIDAVEGRRHLLRDPFAWFDQLCARDETRKWVLKMNRAEQDVFMVTGYFTFLDARVTVKGTAGSSGAVDVSVPVDKILSTAAVQVPVGFGMDAGVNWERGKGREKDLSYSASGEQVFALQLKKLKLRFWPRDPNNPLELDKRTIWIDLLSEERGAGGEVVEADLSDGLGLSKPTRVKDDDADDEFVVLGA